MGSAANWEDSFWRQHETDAEHAARVEQVKDEAGWYFAQATKRQTAEHRQQLKDIEPYKGSPRWKRLQHMAQVYWHQGTAEARELCDRTCACLMEHGEVSEELDNEWTALIQREAVAAVMQAAE